MKKLKEWGGFEGAPGMYKECALLAWAPTSFHSVSRGFVFLWSGHKWPPTGHQECGFEATAVCLGLVTRRIRSPPISCL